MSAWRRELLFPNRGLAVGLLVMLAATLASAGYLFYTVMTQRVYIKRAGENVAAAFVLRDLYLQLQAAESAGRGYLLTGETDYLDQLRASQRDIPARLRELRATPAAADYRADIDRLQAVIDARMRLLQAGVNRRGTTDLNGFTATANFPRGKSAMDDARRELNALSGRILAAAAPEQRRADSALTRAQFLAPLVVVVVLATCIIITRYYTKGIETERSIEGTKNEFLSLASHQLRTPATNVKQYIHLVLDGYYGDITPEQRKALETANRNNNIEINIINELLNIAKVDLNQILVTLEPHEARPLVRQVMRDFRAPLKKRHQKLRFEAGTQRGTVPLDPTYFKSVVENLIDNASKYSPPHSTISLHEAFAGNRYVLTVADKGVGIPRQQQHRLFKKFSRIPNELSDAVEGSGLGLYWVKRVVELHNGTISVESRPGDGSKFIVSLPAAGP